MPTLQRISLRHHLASVVAVIGLSTAITLLALHFAAPKHPFDINAISLSDVIAASRNTFYRMLVAYGIAVIVAIPMALLITASPRVQRVLFPIVDILQSIPVLAFFPVVVVFFAAYGALETAAIFVIFVQMVWNVVFPVVGGLQTIPDDVKSAAIVFRVHGWRRFWYITLPAILPFVITGSLLAWAQGWTVVIVAEVLHTYIPHGSAAQDLLGLGSLLVDSNAEGRTSLFVAALAAMIVLITLMNVLVWQPLLHLAQRFRFD